MDNRVKDELPEAHRPIASLISKSEKAQQKLTPGTWQHTMLRDNLAALRIASALMRRGTTEARHFTRDDLAKALRSLATMSHKAGKAQSGFAPGTSQHTLQQNRLKALRLAKRLTKMALDQQP